MIEWALSYLRRMTDEQKRELARAFLAPSQIMFKLLERENVTVQVVDEFIQTLEGLSEAAKKRRELVPLSKGYLEERLEGETAIQYGERLYKEFFKEDHPGNGSQGEDDRPT